MVKCPDCHRRFRSKQAYELAQRRKAVIEDLQLTKRITYSHTPSLTKHDRHIQDSADFRQHGDRA